MKDNRGEWKDRGKYFVDLETESQNYWSGKRVSEIFVLGFFWAWWIFNLGEKGVQLRERGRGAIEDRCWVIFGPRVIKLGRKPDLRKAEQQLAEKHRAHQASIFNDDTGRSGKNMTWI